MLDLPPSMDTSGITVQVLFNGAAVVLSTRLAEDAVDAASKRGKLSCEAYQIA